VTHPEAIRAAMLSAATNAVVFAVMLITLPLPAGWMLTS
jgi:hypothetical protein